MDYTLTALLLMAAGLGFSHTIAGPDHYVPFIVLAKARNWKLRKTLIITGLCGFGHVFSSIIIGSAGIAMGIGANKLESIESTRGNYAGWAFVIFGILYMLWGIWRALKNKPHKHIHLHQGGIVHDHKHLHEGDHDHIHEKEKVTNITPWVLFIIFILGPCEVLIPLLMVPASKLSIFGIVMVSLVFSLTTIITMMVVVYLLTKGYKLLKLGKLERYTHAIAGLIVLLAGLGIIFGL